MKHTQSENGKVTITMTQEKAVRSHPQIPMPMSPSLAGRKEKKLRVGQKVRKTFFWGKVVIWHSRVDIIKSRGVCPA